MATLPDDVISVVGVSHLWKCHVSCVYRAIGANRLPAWRVAGRWRVSRADAVAAIRRTGPGAAVGGKPAVPRISHRDADHRHRAVKATHSRHLITRPYKRRGPRNA